MAKKVTESALMAALSFMLYMAGSLIPLLSGFIILVCPLPIVYIGVQYGGRRAAMAAMCTAVLVGLTFGPTEAYLYTLPFGVTGVLTGHLLYRDEDPNRMLLIGTGVLLVLMMPAAMFLEKAMGLGDAVVEMQKQMLWFAQTFAYPVCRLLWHGLPVVLAGFMAATVMGFQATASAPRRLRVLAILALVLGAAGCLFWLFAPAELVSAGFRAKLPGRLSAILATWMKLPIGVFFAVSLVMFYSNHLFSFLLFIRLRIPVTPPPDLRNYRMGRPVAILGFLMAAGCCWARPTSGTVPASLFLNLFTIILFLGYVGGMSLMAVMLDVSQLHPLARMAVSAAVMLPCFPLAIALGFLDAIFHLKEWLRSKGLASPAPLAGFGPIRRKG